MRYTINPFYTLHKYFTSKNVAFNCSYIMAVGTGGRGAIAPPLIFCQPKTFKIIKTTTVYRNMAKIC